VPDPKLPCLLPVVDEPPRTGQLTKKPFQRLELVDSTRVDAQHRLTRRQVGLCVPLGRARGRHVKTLAVEIQYRSATAPRLVFRLDAWECRKDTDLGGAARLWYRSGRGIRMSPSVMADLVRNFGVASGGVSVLVQAGVDALREARQDFHTRRLAALAELDAAKKALEAGTVRDAPRQAPTQPRALELGDLVGFG